MARTKERLGSAVFEFCLSIRLFFRASEGFAREAGLSPMEYDLILALSARPNSTSTSIAKLSEQLLAHHHVASEAVGRLVEKELLKTERNAQDRRSVTLALTPKGKSLLEEVTFRSIEKLKGQGPQMLETLTNL